MRTAPRKHEAWFEDLRDEFNKALPAIIAGKVDRTDLMKSCKRIAKGPVTVREIIGAVSAETGVPVGKMTGHRSTTDVVLARRLAMCLAHDLCPVLTYDQIAVHFGRSRDTVRLAMEGARRLLAEDTRFCHWYKNSRWRLGLA